jgi:hypothetical protein
MLSRRGIGEWRLHLIIPLFALIFGGAILIILYFRYPQPEKEVQSSVSEREVLKAILEDLGERKAVKDSKKLSQLTGLLPAKHPVRLVVEQAVFVGNPRRNPETGQLLGLGVDDSRKNDPEWIDGDEESAMILLGVARREAELALKDEEKKK